MTEVKSDITEIDQQASGDVTDTWGKSNAASSHRLKQVGYNFLFILSAAKMDHSDCDCFVLAVLSHGEMGILYSKDSPYKPDSLWSPFTADKCPTLAGKPKLFFLQACQGDKLDGGITLRRTEVDGGEMAYKIPVHADFLIAYSTVPDLIGFRACQGDKLDGGITLRRTEVDGGEMAYKIPVHADFLIAYSTVPGYYSWRNTTNGSWFMQALCCELQDKGFTTDILTLLTFVIQRVALDFESNTPGNYIMHQQKQIPCVTTMLTRLLQFTKK
ncbi:Caspase-1 [Blattella germanica]|nr:Caspase-1 [Blattella germanica]